MWMHSNTRLIAIIATGLLVASCVADDVSPDGPLASGASEAQAGPAVLSLDAISETTLTDKYIVAFHDDVADPMALATELTRRHRGTGRFVFRSVMRGFSGKFSPTEIAAIAARPDVKYVEPIAISTAASSGMAPTDSFNLDLIDQSTLGRNNTYTWDQDGSGVTAYVIDSGLSAGLPEFQGRAQVVADFTDLGGGWGADCANHGTAVAALLGGATWGVARNVQLRAVRVLGCSNMGSTDWIVAGMDWVNAHGVRPAVVNMSLGGARSSAMNNAIARLENSGFRTIVSAGNSNADAFNFSPASGPTTFTVGNALYTGTSLIRNPDSNFGFGVGIWAPGQNLVTIDNNGRTWSFNGTSGASPQVAGWVAIYLSSAAISRENLRRYADHTSKMTVSDSRGLGKFLFTRLEFFSMINEIYGSVDFNRPVSFTTTQFQGVPPYSFTWRQNGVVVGSCTGQPSCIVAPPDLGSGDVITLTSQDATGRISTDSTSYFSQCLRIKNC